MLVSDCTTAQDPLFPQPQNPMLTSRLGYGLVIKEYGAGREGNSEFFAKVRGVFDREKVRWQTHSYDAGYGGNTIAAWFATQNMDVIDVGIGLLSMHSPFEVSSKVDLWHLHRGFGRVSRQLKGPPLKDSRHVNCMASSGYAPDTDSVWKRERTSSKSWGRLLMAVLIASAGYRYAQLARDFFDGVGELRGEQGDPAELPPRQWPDRNLAGCHMLYTSVRREANGAGWRTDYPWAQRNLLIRLSELTKTRVSWLKAGVPHVWLVRLTDPALFECSYLMASDVGTLGLSQEEADALQLYLEKGGFLWVDDFWGEAAWDQWSRELARAMPSAEYTIEDVPLSDPFSTRCSK